MKKLALALLLALPLTAYAALININTADSATLQTLPGIGPSKAQAIIDYRTQHGPFAVISDIQNVSGIGPSTYASIQALITVGSTESASTTTSTTTATTTSSGSSGGGTAMREPPTAITINAGPDRQGLVAVPNVFTALAKVKSGEVDALARLRWSFGDGTKAEGDTVSKTYHYPGTYVVTVVATDGLVNARDELIIRIGKASVRISAITSEGVVIVNEAEERLDLAHWRLGSPQGTFYFPEDTTLLPGAGVLFSYETLGLPPFMSEARLFTPNGSLAAYLGPTEVQRETLPAEPLQPSPAATSSQEVQKVESVVSTSPEEELIEHNEDTAIGAPSAPAESAALGASALTAVESGSTSSPLSGLMRSPWLYGLGALMLAAAGAFIYL